MFLAILCVFLFFCVWTGLRPLGAGNGDTEYSIEFAGKRAIRELDAKSVGNPASALPNFNRVRGLAFYPRTRCKIG
jgi:hypothetical protein